MEVRHMRSDELGKVKALQKLSDVMQIAVTSWFSWGNWDAHPPVVVVDGGSVAGAHFYYTTKSGYINSQSQYVRPEYRGQGLAGDMVNFILANESARRLKFRCNDDGYGDAFWQGFGLTPMGYNHLTWVENVYDLSLEGVGSLEDMLSRAEELCDDVTEDKRSIRIYRKQMIEMLNPAWGDVLAVTPLRLVVDMLIDNCMCDAGNSWSGFLDLSVPDRLAFLIKHFSDEWDFDKLYEQASSLTVEQANILACGDESDLLALLNSKDVQYLDDFMACVFDWNG